MATLRDHCARHARASGSAVALAAPDRPDWTYAKLERGLERAGTALAALGYGRGTRIASGNRQLERAIPALAAGSASGRFLPLVRRVVVRPRLWGAFVAYCYGYAAPRVAARTLDARGRIPDWNRDETSRSSA